MPEESHTRSYTGPTLASMILAERRVIPYREIPEKHSDYVFKPYDEFVDAVEALFGKHELPQELKIEFAGIAARGWKRMSNADRASVERGIEKFRRKRFNRPVNDHDLIGRLIDIYEFGSCAPMDDFEVVGAEQSLVPA
jgi:hypothetical protein